MPEILRNLTVARFYLLSEEFTPLLGKFTRKRKYLANRFSHTSILRNLKYSSAKINTVLAFWLSF